jgi:hypothetical protein
MSMSSQELEPISELFTAQGRELVGTAAVAAFGLALGIAVMLLWNWLLPTLFDFPETTYWQAVGLFVLCHLLFKGPSTGGGGKNSHRSGRGGDHDGGLASRLKNRFPSPADEDAAPATGGEQ